MARKVGSGGIMRKLIIEKKKEIQWLIIGLPLLALCGSAFLPLKPIVSQALIGVLFIWFQVTILLGFFS